MRGKIGKVCVRARECVRACVHVCVRVHAHVYTRKQAIRNTGK